MQKGYPDETRLVMCGTVEGDKRHPPHVQVRVLQGLQELTCIQFLKTVLRIHDVLIQILGTLSQDDGSGSCSFLQWLSNCQQKISFFLLITGL
jgi:hypothetical protein